MTRVKQSVLLPDARPDEMEMTSVVNALAVEHELRVRAERERELEEELRELARLRERPAAA